MIRKSLVLSIAFLFGINAPIFSQSLLKHIPDDVTFVTSFNPSTLNAKIPFSKLREFDFYKLGMDQIASTLGQSNKEDALKLLSDPATLGMDLMASSYVFGKVTSEGNAFSFMFKLSDVTKFNKFLKSKMPPNIEIISKDGYHIVTPEQDMAFAWTNEFVLITGVEVNRKYDFDFEDYSYKEDNLKEEDFEVIEEEEPVLEETEAIEEKPVTEEEDVVEEELAEEEMDYNNEGNADAEHEEKERKFTADWVSKVMNCEVTSSVMNNPKFILANAKKMDASLWLDYASVYELYTNTLGDYGGGFGYGGDEAAMIMEMMESMYEDTYMNMGLNFDVGAVNLIIDSYTNSQMMKFYREAADSKFNKKIHKYVQGESLMGYWSINFNVEKTVKGYRDLFLPMFNKIPMYGSMANDMMGIMDVFIDEEAIYDLWKGDAIFAVTGMKDFEKTITTYEYDEDFNKKEIQKTVTQKLPEFIMMSSYGNEENVLKFIKLGEKTPFLENKGSYFQATIPEVDMDVYIALHKGILFFTNNLDLVQNHLSKGYPKKERMSKAQCERINNNSMVLFWDIPQTLNAASALGVPLEGPQGEILNVSKNSFESIVWTAPKSAVSSINQTISLNFVNKEMNSMEQIFNYVNEIMVMMMGGAKM